MIDIIFKGCGVVGVIFISLGVLTQVRKRQDLYYILGGVFLEAYSIYLKDWIFIVLQLVFLAAVFFDEYRIYHESHTMRRRIARFLKIKK